MISINATTQPAIIPPTSLPSSSFCSCLASIEGDVAITSVLELVMKFMPPIEVTLFIISEVPVVLALTVKSMLLVGLAFVIELVMVPAPDAITLVAAIELVLDVRSEVIILVEIILAVETEAIITSVDRLVELTLLAVTTHEIMHIAKFCNYAYILSRSY